MNKQQNIENNAYEAWAEYWKARAMKAESDVKLLKKQLEQNNVRRFNDMKQENK